MSHRIETIALPAMSPGTQRTLKVHRFGTSGARPKAYLQAALHADELPGMLAAHHLLGLLRAADARGEIKGEIVLVPVANPIGLGQNMLTVHAGARYARGGGDFNRDWPDLFEGLRERVEPQLGNDEAANVRVIRAALADTIASMPNHDELSALCQILMGFAYDADIVLDLHCDDEALQHVYMMPQHWPEGADLAAELGAAACLLCDDSGLFCFDETFSLPFTKLRKELGDRFSIPAACFAATVEFRGQSDVFDKLAEKDAAALLRFLQRRKLIAGDPGPLPAPCEAKKLDFVEMVEVPVAGLVAYKAELGERVKSGDLVAEIVDPMADDPVKARTPIRARRDGLILTRCLKKLAAPGDTIMMIVPPRSAPPS
ncbi:succinylglutamate desuccinylase/aspartoacylase family protein [Dongia deserti]|uniref:succinylglutamate desuccinylase/aspartoacylase family protein n=1 Tax=Dongia deserti TaxID=2268030 RepID=UPI000E64E71E|nr:succinylglutamate desuccinylase/aspartoacylase family protein [Dongia deserti]